MAYVERRHGRLERIRLQGRVRHRRFSSTHFFYVDGTQGTSDTPVIWYVAYATVFDLTSTEKYTTTIDANGIYTGTVRANQIIVDSALTVGGSSYNGSISVKDANNSVKVTLDRNGITAVSGKIGGWILGTSALTASAPASGHRIVMGASGYIYHDNPSTGVNYWALNTDGSATFGCGKISFANDGSGYLANQNIKWDASGNVTMTGTINANAGTIGDSSSVRAHRLDGDRNRLRRRPCHLRRPVPRGGHHFVCPVRQQHHTGIRRRIMCHRTYCEQQGEQHL